MNNSRQKITAKQIFQKKFAHKIFNAPNIQDTKQNIEKLVGKKATTKQQPDILNTQVNDYQLQILAQSINMKIQKNKPAQQELKPETQSTIAITPISNTRGQDYDKQPKQAEEDLIKSQKNKVSPKVKSRAKIFKQELIDSIPAQQKTSLHRWTFGDGNTSNKFVIGNWNVNGMRSVYTKKFLFNYINTRKPDILCVTETKMDQKSFDQSPIKLDGYQSYWNFSKCSAGYSGVVVFSKFLPKKGTEDMIEREHSQQGRMLTLQFQKFILINVYFPTSGKQLQRLQYRKRYDTAFRNHIVKLKEVYPNRPILIVGDLNVAHTQLDTHPGKNIMNSPSFTLAERKGLTQLLNMGFTDVYRALNPNTRAYTWWYVNIGGREKLQSTGLGRRIDYFLITNQEMKWVKNCQILRQFMGADHCPLQIKVELDL